ANSNLLLEYIGAESDSVKLTDMPINSKVEVHYILAFAIDYTSDNHPSPTNGRFNVFWETNHLGPSQIASVKDKHSNVKVAVSLGGDSVVSDNNKVYFSPKSINSWVKNAVSSLTSMIKQYNLDGIDLDYENFHSHDEDTFAECIGQLITTLKKTRTIKFASIAPYEDDELVNSHYLALWKKYGHEVSLASFISKGNTGLPPNDGFFEACKELKSQGKLGGIFVWCADDSKDYGFSTHKNVTIPEFTELCLYATPPPDTKARASSAFPISKCQEQCIATVAQIPRELASRARIRLVLSGSVEGGGPEGTDDREETPPPLTKEQIEGHESALKSLIKSHNQRNKGDPIRLDFELEDTEVQDHGIAKGKKVMDEDLRKPFKEARRTPLTRRIIEFAGPEYKMPTNIKLYDGTTDPEDHLSRFASAANSGEWPMPVWCRMFQQTLDGSARGWFERLPHDNINEWADLREAFASRYSVRRVCFKEPHEITKIVRKANESLTTFKERWTVETGFYHGCSGGHENIVIHGFS
ncbi:reverse transcriptase domain-containing protein, partial [Tanacetum coccineum]